MYKAHVRKCNAIWRGSTESGAVVTAELRSSGSFSAFSGARSQCVGECRTIGQEPLGGQVFLTFSQDELLPRMRQQSKSEKLPWVLPKCNAVS